MDENKTNCLKEGLENIMLRKIIAPQFCQSRANILRDYVRWNWPDEVKKFLKEHKSVDILHDEGCFFRLAISCESTIIVDMLLSHYQKQLRFQPLKYDRYEGFGSRLLCLNEDESNDNNPKNTFEFCVPERDMYLWLRARMKLITCFEKVEGETEVPPKFRFILQNFLPSTSSSTISEREFGESSNFQESLLLLLDEFFWPQDQDIILDFLGIDEEEREGIFE